jgi:hypothetical protein
VSEKGILRLTNKLAKLGSVLVSHRQIKLGTEIPIQILRQGGCSREQGTHLGKATKSPYLLHPDDHFTTLVVRNCHKVDLKHSGGIRCLRCELKRSCWVTGSIDYLRKLLKECTLCRKMRPRPTITRMAPFPEYCVPSEEGARPSPYKNVTLDAAGPWKTVQGRGKTQTKRWFLIFQCMLYGLVYFEMLYHMDSASFLAAFDRFWR